MDGLLPTEAEMITESTGCVSYEATAEEHGSFSPFPQPGNSQESIF